MPDGVTTEWHGPQALEMIDAAAQAGLAAVGDFYVETLREVVGTPGPEPSEPGEPPHLQSGDLQAGIHWEVTPDGKGVEIVSDSEEGAFTELGTAHMQPRPWMLPTILELQPRAADVFAASATGAGPSAGSALPPLPPGVGVGRRPGQGVAHGLRALTQARQAVGMVREAFERARQTVASAAAAAVGWVRRRWR